jgi:hypothetical protein
MSGRAVWKTLTGASVLAGIAGVYLLGHLVNEILRSVMDE